MKILQSQQYLYHFTPLSSNLAYIEEISESTSLQPLSLQQEHQQLLYTSAKLQKLVTFRHFSSLLGCLTSAQGCTSFKVPESGQVIIWEYNNKVYFGYIVQTTN